MTSHSRKRRAVVLLSGGLDSATCLYWAKKKGYFPLALAVAYGQRHGKEVLHARRMAKAAGAKFYLVKLPLPWLATSSLVGRGRKLPDVPVNRIGSGRIPSTYVPGRNTIFVSLGISLADAANADAVVVGANALDFSGYPDCRPAFYDAFQAVARRGTKRGSEGKRLRIVAPLLKMNKAQIVRAAFRMGVPVYLTWSCYKGTVRPCGRCDSCKLRAKGFEEAGVPDPAL